MAVILVEVDVINIVGDLKEMKTEGVDVAKGAEEWIGKSKI